MKDSPLDPPLRNRALRLSELIREDLIKVELEATNKWEAIEELIDLLVATRALRPTDRDEVMETIFERERSLTTGLGNGLAVPHGAVDCVGSIAAALGTSRRGIPFESLDGEPIHLIVLLVIPEGAFQRHVRTLAGVVNLGANPDLRERIFRASSADEVMEVIRDADDIQGTAGG